MDRSKRAWCQERGEIKWGSIILLLIILGGLYLAYKLVPIKMAYYKFEDTMQEQAKFASGRHVDPDGMRGTLMKNAKELEIPIREEDIVINWTTNHITVTATWTVDVDLLGYIKHWQMIAKADSPLFD